MSRIGPRDTKPELTLRRALHGLGYRYRLGGAGLPGRPDLVLPRYRTAIFVHGCFWHRHEGCSVATMPKTNVEFWENKFARNVERDRRVTADLASSGWRVVVVWECELFAKNRNSTVSTVADYLRSVAPDCDRDAAAGPIDANLRPGLCAPSGMSALPTRHGV